MKNIYSVYMLRRMSSTKAEGPSWKNWPGDWSQSEMVE